MRYFAYKYYQKEVVIVKNSNHVIEMDLLISCIAENKISKSDKKFILDNLSLDKRNIFEKLLIEENIKYKKKNITQYDNKDVFRSQMITVFNQPMLLSELLIAMSQYYKDTTIAVLESDRLNPQLEIYLNSDRNIKGIYTHLDVNRTTSLNLLIDAIHKNNLTKQYVENLSTKVYGCKNISFFTGSYLIGDYEYYHIEDYKKIIDFLRLQYDVLIVSTNQFIYDAFTCMSLIESDINLIGIKGSMPDFMEAKRYFDFLEEKQNISSNKNLYLLFDYCKKTHISENVIRQYVKKNYIGSVKENSERKIGIHSHYPYLRNISKRNMKEYRQILNKIVQRL